MNRETKGAGCFSKGHPASKEAGSLAPNATSLSTLSPALSDLWDTDMSRASSPVAQRPAAPPRVTEWEAEATEGLQLGGS